MHCPGRDEHERAWPKSFYWIRIRVEDVVAFKDVEGFRLVVGVRGVIETWVLRRLSESPVAACLGTGCQAGDSRLPATHWKLDVVPSSMLAQDHLRPLLIEQGLPPL